MSASTPAGQVEHGATHWILQRLSAVIVAVLVVWLTLSLALIPSTDHAVISIWIAQPLTAALLCALVIAACFHMALGLQVIIEDYVHVAEGVSFGIRLVRIVCILLAVAGVGAVVKIALGAP